MLFSIHLTFCFARQNIVKLVKAVLNKNSLLHPKCEELCEQGLHLENVAALVSMKDIALKQ